MSFIVICYTHNFSLSQKKISRSPKKGMANEEPWKPTEMVFCLQFTNCNLVDQILFTTEMETMENLSRIAILEVFFFFETEGAQPWKPTKKRKLHTGVRTTSFHRTASQPFHPPSAGKLEDGGAYWRI
jgi:hypothetical protein